MAKRDRLCVIGVVREEVEERPRSFAVALIPREQRRTVEPDGGEHLLVILKIPRFVFHNPVTIILNGDPYELAQPVTVAELLTRLEIDPRRVAVEHNLTIVKRAAFESTILADGDAVEIVNFVGGG
jgi:sulfur carrier protein